MTYGMQAVNGLGQLQCITGLHACVTVHAALLGVAFSAVYEAHQTSQVQIRWRHELVLQEYVLSGS